MFFFGLEGVEDGGKLKKARCWQPIMEIYG